MNNFSSKPYRHSRYSISTTRKLTRCTDDRKLKQFLEIEKNTFDCIKPFLTFSFMLNAGGIGALFIQKEYFIYSIKILCYGSLASITCYFISLFFFIFSLIFLNLTYNQFIKSRILSYSFLIIGFFISVISFDFAIYSGFSSINDIVFQAKLKE